TPSYLMEDTRLFDALEYLWGGDQTPSYLMEDMRLFDSLEYLWGGNDRPSALVQTTRVFDCAGMSMPTETCVAIFDRPTGPVVAAFAHVSATRTGVTGKTAGLPGLARLPTIWRGVFSVLDLGVADATTAVTGTGTSAVDDLAFMLEVIAAPFSSP